MSGTHGEIEILLYVFSVCVCARMSPASLRSPSPSFRTLSSLSLLCVAGGCARVACPICVHGLRPVVVSCSRRVLACCIVRRCCRYRRRNSKFDSDPGSQSLSLAVSQSVGQSVGGFPRPAASGAHCCTLNMHISAAAASCI